MAPQVFDDVDLQSAQNIQWLFQRSRNEYEPIPKLPRGWYATTGYARQRSDENNLGESILGSWSRDVAALYFQDEAARGGYGGYLLSHRTTKQWLPTATDKLLVGYPLHQPRHRGRMYATTIQNVGFKELTGPLYSTTDIQSFPGNSGGPIYVEYSRDNFLPAGIYLGRSGTQTVIRVIDAEVVDLIHLAETASGTEPPTIDDSPDHFPNVATDKGATSGVLRVQFSPAWAVTEFDAGWRLLGGQPAYRTEALLLRPGNYTLEFNPIANLSTPQPEQIRIQAGNTTIITADYQTLSELWLLGSLLPTGAPKLRVLGTAGQSFTLERTTNLSPPIQWSRIRSHTLPLSGLLDVEPDIPNHIGQAFFRVLPQE